MRNHVLCDYTGRTPQVYFSPYTVSQNQNFEECGTHFKFVFNEFSTFFADIWQERCPIIGQQNRGGEFLFFSSFKSYGYFNKGNGCFLNSHNSTAC